MKPKWMPKPGDVVRVYGFSAGGILRNGEIYIIEELGPNGCVAVANAEVSFLVHAKQCRLLKNKKAFEFKKLEAWLIRSSPISNNYSTIFKSAGFIPPVPSTVEYIRAAWLDPPSK